MAKNKAAKLSDFVYLNVKAAPGLVRNARMEGREYRVAPAVVMVEGVHNGQAGPILYTQEELAKVPVSANHKPVVVYHPMHNGTPASACDPIEISSRKIGVVMNASFDKGFVAEAWLEQDRMQTVDDRVSSALDNNEMMEISMGVYMNMEKIEGTWHNSVTNEDEPYIGIAHDMIFDHLAVLPDMTGACSIADGGGLLRVNMEGDGDEEEIALVENGVDVTENYIRIRQKAPGSFDKDTFKTISITKGIKAVVGKLKNPPKGKEGSMTIQTYLFDKDQYTTATAKAWVKKHSGVTTLSAAMILNELGHESLRRILRAELVQKKGTEMAWIEEVYSTYFIYEQEGKLYKQDYSESNGTVDFTGTVQEVVKVTEYRTLDGKFIGNTEANREKGDQTMDKKKVVDSLIANEKTPWREEDREMLMKMQDAQLEHLSAAIKEEQPKPAQNPQQTVDNPATVIPSPVANNQPAGPQVITFKTAAEYTRTLPPDVAAFVDNGLAVLKEQTEKLVEVICASPRNTFRKEWLLTRPITELRAMAALAQPEAVDDLNIPATIPVYSGQEEVVGNRSNPQPTAEETEPLLVPSMAALLQDGRQKKQAG